MGNAKLDSTKLMPAAPQAPKPRPGLWLCLVLALGCPLLVAGRFTERLTSQDEALWTANPMLRPGVGISGGLAEAFRPQQAGPDLAYQPLAQVSVALQVAVGADQPWAFRFVNLLLHLCTALMLFQVLRRLLPSSPSNCPATDSLNSDAALSQCGTLAAAFGAAVFFFHPAQVEIVALALGRGPVQGLFLAVLAWWLMTSRAQETLAERELSPPSVLRFSLALALYLAAVLSEPAAIGFALVFALSEVFCVQGDWGGRLARALGFVFLALGGAVLAFQHGGQSLPAGAGPLTVWGLWGQQLAHALAPWAWSADPEAVSGFGDLWVWGTACMVLGLSVLLYCLPVNNRVLAIYVPAVLLTLFVSLGAGGPQQAASLAHLYLPLGLSAVLVTLAAEAIHYRFRFLGVQRGKIMQAVCVVVGILLCMALGALALQRTFADDAGATGPSRPAAVAAERA